MRYHFPQSIIQLSLLLVGNPSSGGSHVMSLGQRERGGGGLRRNLNGISVSDSFERLLEGDEDGAVDDETADDSSANGDAVAFASRVQNWESAAVSKLNDWETVANSTAWEFYESPPSQWTQHQWDLVIDLLLGLGSIIILCCICCVNLCSERVVEKAPSPSSPSLPPEAAIRHQSRFFSLWGPRSPPGSSSFFSGSTSTSWSPQRRSRRHRRGGARDSRRRLIDSDDETDKRRGSESDGDESTDDDCSVESLADQSTAYEPPECMMSEESNDSTLFSSFDSQSAFSPKKNQAPVEVTIDDKKSDAGKHAIDNEKKGTLQDKTGEEVTACHSISIENKIDSIEVGTQVRTRNPGMNVFMYNTKEEDIQDEKASATKGEIDTSPRNRGINNSMSGDWKKKLLDMKKRMDQRKSAVSPDLLARKERKPPSLAVEEGSKTNTGENPVLSNAGTMPLVSAHVDGRSKETDEIGATATGTKARELEELIRDVLERPVGEGQAMKKRRKKKKETVL